jgi:hypothetical protein
LLCPCKRAKQLKLASSLCGLIIFNLLFLQQAVAEIVYLDIHKKISHIFTF